MSKIDDFKAVGKNEIKCISPEEKGSDNEYSNFIPEKNKKGASEKITTRDALPQIFASCVAHCIVIQVGIGMAFSTVFIEDIKRSGEMIINKDHESWITSLVTIGVPVGSLVAGPLMDKFGRKTICVISCIPSIISWILLITANSIKFIYISRCIAGFSSGLTTVGLIYVSEITHPRIRPMMLCCNSVFVSLGILITCCLAVWLNWHQMSIVFLVMNCIFLVALLIIPESPYWYLCFKDAGKSVSKAEKSLKWLNRNDKIYASEYSRIKEISQNREVSNRTLIEKLINFCDELQKPQAYKPLLILAFLFLIQQLSGCYVIIFYAISVFKNIQGSTNETEDSKRIYGALVILGIVRFIVSIVTAYFSKIYSRRFLCMSSGLGMSFAMFFSGMYMYLTSTWDGKENIQSTINGQKWILIVIIIFYISTSAIGFMVIPWTLIGELLPISIKGTASGFLIALAYAFMFGVMKAYLYVLEAIGTQGTFFFFSFFSLLGTVYVYFFLPETLGKSFSEIEKCFVKESKPKNRNNMKI